MFHGAKLAIKYVKIGLNSLNCTKMLALGTTKPGCYSAQSMDVLLQEPSQLSSQCESSIPTARMKQSLVLTEFVKCYVWSRKRQSDHTAPYHAAIFDRYHCRLDQRMACRQDGREIFTYRTATNHRYRLICDCTVYHKICGSICVSQIPSISPYKFTENFLSSAMCLMIGAIYAGYVVLLGYISNGQSIRESFRSSPF